MARRSLRLTASDSLRVTLRVTWSVAAIESHPDFELTWRFFAPRAWTCCEGLVARDRSLRFARELVPRAAQFGSIPHSTLRDRCLRLRSAAAICDCEGGATKQYMFTACFHAASAAAVSLYRSASAAAPPAMLMDICRICVAHCCLGLPLFREPGTAHRLTM